jgi:hypothetical protein
MQELWRIIKATYAVIDKIAWVVEWLWLAAIVVLIIVYILRGGPI